MKFISVSNVPTNQCNMGLTRELIIWTTLLVAVLATPTKPGSTPPPDPEPPVWPKAYSVEGTIILPYVPINEPFVAHVDKSDGGGKSRIDYYDGTMKTIQSDGNRICYENQFPGTVISLLFQRVNLALFGRSYQKLTIKRTHGMRYSALAHLDSKKCLPKLRTSFLMLAALHSTDMKMKMV